jgi:1,4-alpha-glucan branching enzyme
MAPIGAFTFVLHAHIPYCRRAGRWPHGEEWLHEAIAETYLPLLDALYDLHEEGVPARLTLSLTPVLAEQLADPLIQEHFIEYAQDRRSRAEQDVARFEAEGNPHLRELARFYVDYYDRRLRSFIHRYGRDLIGAFRRLQEAGVIELITSAATHGYLPLLSRDSSIRGQLRAGIWTYRRFFGRDPFSIWLPECAYRPAYRLPDGTIRPGLEYFLAREGSGCSSPRPTRWKEDVRWGKAAGRRHRPLRPNRAPLRDPLRGHRGRPGHHLPSVLCGPHRHPRRGTLRRGGGGPQQPHGDAGVVR